MADLRLGALTMDDKEQQHLLAALRQPLFIQTPLQAMLEHVLQKMQKHSQIISEAWDKIHFMEQRQNGFVDLLARLELMETRVEAATSCRMSPFGQADILLRLEAVEVLAAKTDQHMQAAQLQATQDVQPRLQTVEKQLHGVSNLGGRLIALDEVAYELGVPIMDMDAEVHVPAHAAVSYSKLIQQSAQQAGTAPEGPAAAPQAAHAGWPNDHPHAEEVSEAAAVPRHSVGGARRSGAGARQSGGGAHNNRPHRDTAHAHSTHNTSSNDGTVSSSHDDGTAGGGGDGSQDAHAHANSSRSRPGSARQRPTSFSCGGAAAAGERPAAKFQALQDQIDALREDGKAMAASLEALTTGLANVEGSVVASEARSMASTSAAVDAVVDVMEARLVEQVAGLRKEVMNKPPDVSYAEFCKVQSAMEGAHAAASTASAVAKQLEEKELPGMRRAVGDLQRRLGRALGVRDADKALSDAVTELKGDIESVRAKVDEAGAALLASEGVATGAEVQELLQLMRTKASKEDLKSVMGRAMELALDSYRAASMDSAGAGATRFKCLTCNRDVVDAPTTRHSSPPRAAVADEFKASGNSSGAQPMGPGLNAAHLRRLAEERMSGDRGVLHSSGSLDTGERPSTASPGRLHTITAELALEPDSFTRHTASGSNTARLASATGQSPGMAKGSRPWTATGGSEGRGGMLHKGRPPTARSSSQRMPVFL